MPPHIFALSDYALRSLRSEGKSQSILIRYSPHAIVSAATHTPTSLPRGTSTHREDATKDVFERELKARGLAEVQALCKELIESAKSTGHVLPTEEELEKDCAPLNQLISDRFDAQMKVIDACAEVLQAQLVYYGDIAAKLVKLVRDASFPQRKCVTIWTGSCPRQHSG